MTSQNNYLETVVDFMAVPLRGDPSIAIIQTQGRSTDDVTCEILIVGGGAGGVAAALAAARNGRSVCLLEETDWLGGQMTSQGVSALDEHAHIEYFGGTRSYYAFRQDMRSHYARSLKDGQSRERLNPGNCWVSELAYEPSVAAAYFDGETEKSGKIRVFKRTKVAGASVSGDRIESVYAVSLDDSKAWRFHPELILDASELGDMLPLTGTAYRAGAESIAETGEPNAQKNQPMPQCVQSFTYVFALERRPAGERHLIPRPDHYSYFKDHQPYSLQIEVHGGEIYSEKSGTLSYSVFDRKPGTKGSLWTYRRLIDAQQFQELYPHDISIINWPGNDYRESSLVDASDQELVRTLQAAKCASLGFLYWLQTEAPAQEARTGAPELMLRTDVMGTTDGLSKHPYIREGRRIVPLRTIVEQDVSAAFQAGERAAHFQDSVGIGWYPIDIHPVAGDVGVSCRTKPFQIPLGSMLPIRTRNLIAAGKSIGTTHVSNGCYRLHPVEWNIGESAGILAAYALNHSLAPRDIWEAPETLADFQRTLLSEGIPLAWIIDVPLGHAAFEAVQALYMEGTLPRSDGIVFRPDEPIALDDWRAWGGVESPPASRAKAAIALHARASQAHGLESPAGTRP